MASMGKGRRKKTRNANRMGGTSARPDGRVDAYVTVDTPLGPKQVKTTKRTQEQADAWLLEVRYLASQGAFASYDSEDHTVGEFVGRWLKDEVKPTVRAISYVGYEKSYRLRINPPPFGEIKLSKLTVANCQAWRSRMAKANVSASEQGKAIRLLKRALEQAVAWEMLSRNPAASLRVPRYRPKETAYVRAEDVPLYLAATRGDPYEALFVVAILGGPRPAELLALRWEDFDEQAGTLRIDESVSQLAGGILDWNEPKTEMGRRVIPLPAQAKRALSEHRARALERRMATGDRSDFDRALVFGRLDDPSRPYGSTALLHRWRFIQDRAGLKRVHLYALRHTASMLLGRSGSDPKTTQGILGHSDIRTTLKVYTHFEEERAREAVNRLDGLLGDFSGNDEGADSGSNVVRKFGTDAEKG
jgi:integrase